MSLTQIVFESLGSLVWSLTPTPWNARCPNCYGDLRWISFWGKRNESVVLIVIVNGSKDHKDVGE